MNRLLVRRTLDRLHRRAATTFLGPEHTRTDGRCRLPPEWLVLCVNNFCDLRCRMCDVGLRDTTTVFWANLIGPDPRNMSAERLDQILVQAEAFRPRPRIGLGFTEPLIHPRIVDFCRTITGRGFYCELTSNGSQLPRLADELVDAGLDELVISLDGPPEVHDRIRGKPGTFAKVAEGLERLRAAKERTGRSTPRVGLSFTISDVNHDRIVDFVEAVAPFRPDSIAISHLNFISASMAQEHNARFGDRLRVVRSNLGEIEPERMPVEALWEELERLREVAREQGPRWPRIHLSPDVAGPEALETYYRDHSAFVGGRACTDPWKLLYVKPDGTAIPAHGRCYDLPVGNIDALPLAELWNAGPLVEFRRTLLAAGGTLPACARCCGVIGKPA